MKLHCKFGGNKMRKIIATKNACYVEGRHITPIGIMLHSTGANNPFLSRYVSPNDGEIGENKYNNSFNTFDGGGRNVCPHAVIGLLKNGNVDTVQILPWNYMAWHSGGGANNTHISVEICEDDLNDSTYFEKIYAEVINFCVEICKMYNLNYNDIIDHAEGFKIGLASNHADVGHWFSKHFKNMDILRNDVRMKLEKPKTIYRVQVGAFSEKENALALSGELAKKGYKNFIVEVKNG